MSLCPLWNWLPFLHHRELDILLLVCKLNSYSAGCYTWPYHPIHIVLFWASPPFLISPLIPNLASWILKSVVCFHFDNSAVLTFLLAYDLINSSFAACRRSKCFLMVSGMVFPSRSGLKYIRQSGIGSKYQLVRQVSYSILGSLLSIWLRLHLLLNDSFPRSHSSTEPLHLLSSPSC